MIMPDILYETIKHLTYPELVNICGSTKVYSILCTTNNLFINLILNKETDYLLSRYQPTEALLFAINNNNDLIVKELLKQGVDPSFNDNIIMNACIKGSIKVINNLLEDPRIDPSIKNNQPLIEAIKNNHVSIVDRLLADPRVDPTDRNNNALILACQYGFTGIVDRLLQDPRVDPSDNDNLAIVRATSYGHLSVINRLLDDIRVNVKARNNAAIKEATRRGYKDIVNRLTIIV